MNELIEFKDFMTCPSCDAMLISDPEVAQNNFYKNGVHIRLWHLPLVTPKFCQGQKTLLFNKCSRFFPHLHWKCFSCKCSFVSETKLGHERMKQIV